MSTARKLMRFSLLLCASLFSRSAYAESVVAPTTASAVIERFYGVLLDSMKQANALGYEGRRNKLAPVVEETYDLPFMAKVATGKYWKELDPPAQQRFVDTFTRLTVANYAGRFNGYDGESFVVVSEGDGGQDTALVRTKLVLKDDAPVELNYRLRQLDGSWRIIDVYLNGTVSELALHRAEYTAKIEREGFEALLRALEEKIAALASGKAAD
jgi:phospholipid transport system substrate-binding protein